MRILLVMLLCSYSCQAQEVPQNPQVAASAAEEQAPADQDQATITVPAGTHMQAALANPLRAGAARVGDSVRAVTTFPLTVEKNLAIPQGAFLEGTIVRVGKRGSTPFDGVEVQFRRVVFANGYNVALDGSVEQAKAFEQGPASSTVTGPLALMASIFQQQQPPAPPPLPQVGPPKGAIIGAVLGSTAAFIVTGILLGHRYGHEQARDFDTGFQFEIVLHSPLTLDAARVTVAHLNLDKVKAAPDAVSERDTVILPK